MDTCATSFVVCEARWHQYRTNLLAMQVTETEQVDIIIKKGMTVPPKRSMCSCTSLNSAPMPRCLGKG